MSAIAGHHSLLATANTSLNFSFDATQSMRIKALAKNTFSPPSIEDISGIWGNYVILFVSPYDPHHVVVRTNGTAGTCKILLIDVVNGITEDTGLNFPFSTAKVAGAVSPNGNYMFYNPKEKKIYETDSAFSVLNEFVLSAAPSDSYSVDFDVLNENEFCLVQREHDTIYFYDWNLNYLGTSPSSCGMPSSNVVSNPDGGYVHCNVSGVLYFMSSKTTASTVSAGSYVGYRHLLPTINRNEWFFNLSGHNANGRVGVNGISKVFKYASDTSITNDASPSVGCGLPSGEYLVFQFRGGTVGATHNTFSVYDYINDSVIKLPQTHGTETNKYMGTRMLPNGMAFSCCFFGGTTPYAVLFDFGFQKIEPNLIVSPYGYNTNGKG